MADHYLAEYATYTEWRNYKMEEWLTSYQSDLIKSLNQLQIKLFDKYQLADDLNLQVRCNASRWYIIV